VGCLTFGFLLDFVLMCFWFRMEPVLLICFITSIMGFIFQSKCNAKSYSHFPFPILMCSRSQLNYFLRSRSRSRSQVSFPFSLLLDSKSFSILNHLITFPFTLDAVLHLNCTPLYPQMLHKIKIKMKNRGIANHTKSHVIVYALISFDFFFL